MIYINTMNIIRTYTKIDTDTVYCGTDKWAGIAVANFEQGESETGD